ncbi:hypothetical protein [Paracoccus pacificus]|uniref:Lipoprotein n=1 Tax=Paracoccus pacificus TaxID=1463598 RepID=A0ABW4R975_9RHOB
MLSLISLRRILTALLLPLLLAACGADNIYASDEAVRAARYSTNQPPYISLMTVIGIPRGEGGHSALVINGSQRVLFDPAGSWQHPAVPERYDVHYGITDNILNFYIDYHARATYYVQEIRVPVSLATADAAIRAAEQNGAVNKSFCAVGTGRVLRSVPGFESMPTGFSPIRLRDAFARLPGAQVNTYYDGDPRIKHNVIINP